MPSWLATALGGAVSGLGTGLGQAANLAMQEHLEQTKADLAMRRDERLRALDTQNRREEADLAHGRAKDLMKESTEAQKNLELFRQEWDVKKMEISEKYKENSDARNAAYQKERDALLAKYGLDLEQVRGNNAARVAGISASAANRAVDISERNEDRRDAVAKTIGKLREELKSLKTDSPEYAAKQKEISRVMQEDYPIAIGQLPKTPQSENRFQTDEMKAIEAELKSLREGQRTPANQLRIEKLQERWDRLSATGNPTPMPSMDPLGLLGGDLSKYLKKTK